MFIFNLVNKASLILRGRSVKVDRNIPLAYLIQLILLSFVSYLRGCKTKHGSFLGRSVVIKGRGHLHILKGVIIGDYVYIDALGGDGLSLGNRVSIGAYTRISVSGSLASLGKGIHIGDDSAIGEFSHIGGAGGVYIGRDTIAGAYLSIHPENHHYEDRDVPIRLQGVNHQGIRIGDNCWIGAKVTILDGASIGNGCVVAAGAVVRGEFPDNVVIGGVPAKVLRQRGNE